LPACDGGAPIIAITEHLKNTEGVGETCNLADALWPSSEPGRRGTIALR
jgi:hypothetical protein